MISNSKNSGETKRFSGAPAGEEPVLSMTRLKGGLLTNPSRGQLKKPLGFLGLLRKTFVEMDF